VQVLMGRGPRDEAVQKAALPSSGVQLGVQFGV
jgi:hypothetical protein